MSEVKHTHCPYCDAEGARLEQTLRIVKEAGATRLDLFENGNVQRVEFPSTPQLVEFVPGELPKDGATEPSPVESAALRLAGRAKKAGAK